MERHSRWNPTTGLFLGDVGGEGDTFVIEDRDEFEVASHAFDDVADG